MLPDIAFLRQLAAAAGAETLPRFRAGASVTNKETVGFDPVTEADRQAELAMRRLIEATYPEHGILGEEFGRTKGDGRHEWVIDPVDGTRAFIAGLPVWGTLCGLTVDGLARCGFMHQPFTGELFAADGTAAWYERSDGTRMHMECKRNSELDAAILFTTSPHLYSRSEAPALGRLQDRVKLFRYGVDCYAFCLLALGQIDLVIEPGLKPYDIVGLVPLVEQAGGVVTTWDGARPEQGGNILASANATLHDKALAELAGR